MDIQKIMTEGIVFKGGKSPKRKTRRESKDKSQEKNLYYRTSWLWFG